MQRHLLIMLVSAAACGSARADWAYTRWGMTPEQVAENSSGDVKMVPKTERTINKDDHWAIAAKGKYKDGPRVLDVSFMFDDKDALKCVLYQARGMDAVAVRADLIKRYGPGTASGYGATHTINWDNPENIEITIIEQPLGAIVTHCRPPG